MVAGDRVERRERGTGEKARFFRVSVRCARAPSPGNRGKVGDIGVIRGRPAARGAFVSEKTPKALRRGIRTSDKDTEQPEDLGLSVAAVLRQIHSLLTTHAAGDFAQLLEGTLAIVFFAG